MDKAQVDTLRSQARKNPGLMVITGKTLLALIKYLESSRGRKRKESEDE